MVIHNQLCAPIRCFLFYYTNLLYSYFYKKTNICVALSSVIGKGNDYVSVLIK